MMVLLVSKLTISFVAKNFGIIVKSEMRLEEMSNDEIIRLAKKISRI